MGLPWTQADPAELSFAVLVPTNHVIAATIFLNGHMAFWTLLSGEESNHFCKSLLKAKCFTRNMRQKSLEEFKLIRNRNQPLKSL